MKFKEGDLVILLSNDFDYYKKGNLYEVKQLLASGFKLKGTGSNYYHWDEAVFASPLVRSLFGV